MSARGRLLALLVVCGATLLGCRGRYVIAPERAAEQRVSRLHPGSVEWDRLHRMYETCVDGLRYPLPIEPLLDELRQALNARGVPRCNVDRVVAPRELTNPPDELIRISCPAEGMFAPGDYALGPAAAGRWQRAYSAVVGWHRRQCHVHRPCSLARPAIVAVGAVDHEQVRCDTAEDIYHAWADGPRPPALDALGEPDCPRPGATMSRETSPIYNAYLAWLRSDRLARALRESDVPPGTGAAEVQSMGVGTLLQDQDRRERCGDDDCADARRVEAYVFLDRTQTELSTREACGASRGDATRLIRCYERCLEASATQGRVITRLARTGLVACDADTLTFVGAPVESRRTDLICTAIANLPFPEEGPDASP